MVAKPFVVETKDYQRPLNIVGEQVTVLASGEETGGYEIFLQRGSAGSGPPPHSHPWDESFFVTKGNVEFGFGEESGTAGAGTLVHIPGGTVHWFRFGAGGAEMLSLTSRAGASKFFTDVAREIAPPGADFVKLAEIAARHGLRVVA